MEGLVPGFAAAAALMGVARKWPGNTSKGRQSDLHSDLPEVKELTFDLPDEAAFAAAAARVEAEVADRVARLTTHILKFDGYKIIITD